MNHLGYYGDFLAKKREQILYSKKFPFTQFLIMTLTIFQDKQYGFWYTDFGKDFLSLTKRQGRDKN